MGFFKRHANRSSYDLFASHSYYLPDFGGVILLGILFLIGALAGMGLTKCMNLISPDFTSRYGFIISYPVMFLPSLLYASAQSRRNEYYMKGYALDSKNFGHLGGFTMAVIAMIVTAATAFMTDSLTKFMPDMPEHIEASLATVLEAPLWISFISASIMAPLFEEWLCRGLILRGLLQNTKPGTAIFISALFFALIHMNPWQAVPAFVFGLLFGYAYYRTGSLKLTMLMHFTNNTLALIFSRIPSLAEAESFIDVMRPWVYVCIFLACAAFTWGAIITLKSIPFHSKDARSNCNEVNALEI